MQAAQMHLIAFPEEPERVAKSAIAVLYAKFGAWENVENFGRALLEQSSLKTTSRPNLYSGIVGMTPSTIFWRFTVACVWIYFFWWIVELVNGTLKLNIFVFCCNNQNTPNLNLLEKVKKLPCTALNWFSLSLKKW